LKELIGTTIPLSERTHNQRIGVWATDNLVLSRIFGIDRSLFGQFYLYPGKKRPGIELVNWKLNDIPDDFIAYTYYLELQDFTMCVLGNGLVRRHGFECLK
jgi:hypothetical protein